MKIGALGTATELALLPDVVDAHQEGLWTRGRGGACLNWI